MTKRLFSLRYVKNAPVKEVRGKLIRNPNYAGELLGHPRDYPTEQIVDVKFKPHFFKALEESIADTGFRNPVIMVQMIGGLALQFGTSRYRVARKLKLESMPAIIVDYTNRWYRHRIVTEENYAKFFTDVPKNFVIDDEGVETHWALERKRRDQYDPAGFAWCGEDAPLIDLDFPWMRGR